jgi:putative phosphoribosyl transferase
LLARREVHIPPIGLAGTLSVPGPVYALVIFAHGSGSSRFSPRNNAVADAFNAEEMATLLFDLLTQDEEADRANVFDIPLLAGRLVDAVRWLGADPLLSKLPLGLFGASTGAAAALVPRHGSAIALARSSPVADGRISQATCSRKSARRRC